MDEVDDALTYERCESFGGGMDAFNRPTLLAPDAYQYGENTFIPDGLEVGTRPGFDSLFTALGGKIQGLLYFDTPTVEQLINVGAAKVYTWNGTLNTERTGWTPTTSSDVMAMAQGVDKALLTDGEARSSATVGGFRVWDGAAFTDPGNGANDPPETATILIWHASRMWASGFPGTTAGKENDALWGSALLDFGAGKWDGTDRNIRIGAGDGDPIMGLASLSSSHEHGFVMAVLKQNSIYLVNTDPTATFTNFTANIGPQQVSDGIGCVGKRAFCVDGNDLLFVSPDRSFRSLARMAGAQGQYEISPPLSLPIQSYVRRINWTYAHLICVKKYGDHVVFSVPLDSNTTPNYAFVWNGRLQRWVGIWSNIAAHDMEVTRYNGVHRFVIGETSGTVRQWKDFADDTDSDTYLDDSVAIPTKLWSRSMLFGEPLNDKDAFHLELRFGSSDASVVRITLYADNASLKTWTENIAQPGLTLPLSLPFDLANPQYASRLKGLRGLMPFNEMFIRVESTAGWWRLRTISISAFLNTLKTQ